MTMCVHEFEWSMILNFVYQCCVTATCNRLLDWDFVFNAFFKAFKWEDT